jgi:hypothetical protein
MRLNVLCQLAMSQPRRKGSVQAKFWLRADGLLLLAFSGYSMDIHWINCTVDKNCFWIRTHRRKQRYGASYTSIEIQELWQEYFWEDDNALTVTYKLAASDAGNASELVLTCLKHVKKIYLRYINISISKHRVLPFLQLSMESVVPVRIEMACASYLFIENISYKLLA